MESVGPEKYHPVLVHRERKGMAGELEEFALLGTRPCGCATCMIFDKPEYVDAAEILQWIRAGVIVQRVPSDVARERMVQEFGPCSHTGTGH